MITLFISSFLVFIVAFLMTMVGKGGGNFYVIILAIANMPMHEAAATGQFILFSASVAAMIIFQKNKSVLWPLAIFIGIFAAFPAMGGGYFSHFFSGFQLKLVFAVMLLITGFVMLIPISQKKDSIEQHQFGTVNIHYFDQIYAINIWIALPVTVLAGFASGMVGVSGGSFLVPLMVLACNVPMPIAVGTASPLIALTAFMGFIGHAVQGDFNPSWAIPLAFITITGGILGGKFALQTKPKHLMRIFAYTNWLAGLFMIGNAFQTKGSI